MRRVPTCSNCGVPVAVDATLCLECRVAAVERMLVLREHLVRSTVDCTLEPPYRYRFLS